MRNLIGHRIVVNEICGTKNLKGKIILGFQLESPESIPYSLDNTVMMYYDLKKSKDAYDYLYKSCHPVAVLTDDLNTQQYELVPVSLYIYERLENEVTKRSVCKKEDIEIYTTKLKLCDNIQIDRYEDFESVIYKYYKKDINEQLQFLDSIWQHKNHFYFVKEQGNKHRYWNMELNLYSEWYENTSNKELELKRILKFEFEYIKRKAMDREMTRILCGDY